MISAALKPNALIFAEPLKFIPDKIYWDNFKTIFQHEYFFKWYGNSIYIVVLTIIMRFVVVTMVLFTFIWTWNDFVNPFIFISSIDKQVVTVGLEYFQEQAGTDYGLQMAGACVIVIIPIILFGLAQKYFVEGIASSGVKG